MITRWINKLDQLLIYISATTLFFMMLLIFSDVFVRSFFNSSITGVMEITGEYLMVIIVYFSVSYAEKYKYHVNIDFFQEKFSFVINKITMLLTNSLAVILFIFIGYNNYLQALKYIKQDIRSVGLLDYSLAPALIIIVIGTVVLSIRLIIDSIKILREKQKDS